MGVLCENHVGMKVLRNVFYALAFSKISVHLVYVDLLFSKSVSFGQGDLCVH